ncbi:MAG: hypothetical protein DRP52_06465 [Planctomycetota bacterium]|nr:MAG: hypothetical protein DRP52_06465 [Planctomycetota bacterium]
MMVYAYDCDDNYPQLPGTGPWSKRLGFDYDNATPDFDEGGAEEKVSRTITSSLYLLVREADVSPKRFICPGNDDKKWYKRSKPKKYIEFTGENTKSLDPVELWDFGAKPHEHVSYAYHNPYGKHPAGAWLPASFAVMADMNPWFDLGNIVEPGAAKEPPQIIKLIEDMTPTDWRPSNSVNHRKKGQKYANGQNVLFVDGHTSHKKQPNVGVNNDNIYTFWSTEENPIEQDKQGGTAPTSRSAENDAKSKDDSFLAI